MLRLFLAVDLPSPVRQEVAALRTQVNGARWVKTHQLHITLRFMGQTPDQTLAHIRDQLLRVRVPAFDLALQGVGTFPVPPPAESPDPSAMNRGSPSPASLRSGSASSKHARVLWLGLDPVEPLVHLKHEIDACLGPDLEHANQDFSPHLTLARFTEKPDATLTQFLSQHQTYRSAHWPVNCFHLYKSTLHSDGAVHEVVATYAFAEFCREQ